MAETNPRAHLQQVNIPEICRERPNSDSSETSFDLHFSRCCSLLYFIARRILGDPSSADYAVRNTFLAASHNPPAFENEGAFRSWLVRILIDQAGFFLHQQLHRQKEDHLPGGAFETANIAGCSPAGIYGSRERRRRVVENKTVVCTFVEEVINQGRFERADDLVAPDFIGFDPLPGQRWQGREGLKEILHRMRSGFPDLRWTVEEMVSEGDLVVTRFICSGTHYGSFLGVPATGRRIRVKGMSIDRVVAGKMADSRILMDRLKLLQQLGAIPVH